MKKRLLTFLTCASITSALGQGTINFRNDNVNIPVYQSEGTTRLAGPQFLAELFAGPDPTNLAAIATTSFLTGNGAGYFYGGTVTVNNVPYTQTVMTYDVGSNVVYLLANPSRETGFQGFRLWKSTDKGSLWHLRELHKFLCRRLYMVRRG